eukprot:1155746-Pelagomonas_calceolata.AAC.6
MPIICSYIAPSGGPDQLQSLVHSAQRVMAPLQSFQLLDQDGAQCAPLVCPAAQPKQPGGQDLGGAGSPTGGGADCAEGPGGLPAALQREQQHLWYVARIGVKVIRHHRWHGLYRGTRRPSGSITKKAGASLVCSQNSLKGRRA